MRRIVTAALLLIAVLLVPGCKKAVDTGNSGNVVPTLSEKYVIVSEVDVSGNYSMPIFKNLSDETVQGNINSCTVDCSTVNKIRERKNTAVSLLSETDLTDCSFSEYGTYKVHCNNGVYISYSLSFEQRFDNDEKFEFVKQNYVFNFDAVTGNEVEIASMFRDADEVSDYIAHKLYDRLLAMDCLESGVYSDDLFKEGILERCAVLPSNKIAVVTTAGMFDLKLSAGAPIIEISIPEEYYSNTK